MVLKLMDRGQAPSARQIWLSPRFWLGFSNLRSFNSSASILKPVVFQVIGGLPLLESLGIAGSRMNDDTLPVLDKDLEIPNTWFPALRHLRISSLHPLDISIIWHQPPLVQNLISATIKCTAYTPGSGWRKPSDGQEWINSFLEGLSRASPHIAELELCFDRYGWRYESFSLLEAREYLRRLPLRHVLFEGSTFTL